MKKAETPPVMELKNIKKTYRIDGGFEAKALQGLSLAINKGDFLAVMGKSGSGKSTLMNIIGLLDRNFEGEYLLNGKKVSSLKNSQTSDIRGQEIGFVFQSFNLLPRTTVLENIMLPTVYHPQKDDEERAIQILKKVGLLDRIKHKSNQLSGGQIQRVAIARALMMNPSILLADEPTGNLDTKTSEEIIELIKEINKSGTTVILITHEEEIAKNAKKIIRLKDGQIERVE